MLQFGEWRAPGMLLSERALHCPGGSLATPPGRCVRSDPKPDGNFLFKGCPERVSSGEPSRHRTLPCSLQHQHMDSSLLPAQTAGQELLTCGSVALTFSFSQETLFFFLHLHLVNKNLPDISLWICQTGQSWPFFFPLILFMSFC